MTLPVSVFVLLCIGNVTMGVAALYSMRNLTPAPPPKMFMAGVGGALFLVPVALGAAALGIPEFLCAIGMGVWAMAGVVSLPTIHHKTTVQPPVILKDLDKEVQRMKDAEENTRRYATKHKTGTFPLSQTR